MAGQTLFDKIWSRHVVTEKHGQTLLYIDRHLLHDGSFFAFNELRKKGLSVRRPDQTFATPESPRCASGMLRRSRSKAPASPLSLKMAERHQLQRRQRPSKGPRQRLLTQERQSSTRRFRVTVMPSRSRSGVPTRAICQVSISTA